jgi:hypothetical protein
LAATLTVWVLDTSTKGTGATMVPLRKAAAGAAERERLAFKPPPRRPKPAEAARPRRPRRFKIVDIMTRRVLAEGVGLRTVLDVLGDVRSVVDVTVSVWQPDAGRWRPLTLDERRALWERRLVSLDQ